MERVGIGLAIRRALDDPKKRAEICAVTGWESSDVSRIKAGNQGIKLDNLDDVMKVLGYVCVEPAYMDFLSYGCRVGAACQCAREGRGSCGR